MIKGQREPMDHAEPFLYRHVQRHEAPRETLQPKHRKQVLQFIFQRQFGELAPPLDSQSPKIESVHKPSLIFKCDLGLWRKFLQNCRSLRIRKIFLDKVRYITPRWEKAYEKEGNHNNQRKDIVGTEKLIASNFPLEKREGFCFHRAE